MRHSASISCALVSHVPVSIASSGYAAWPGAGATYVDVEVLVDLDGVAEQAEVLREVRELPHVPERVQRAGLFRGLFCLHLVACALAGGHCEGRVRRGTRPEGAQGRLYYKVAVSQGI